MKKKTVRTLLLLFTLVFTVSSFSISAWAESGTGDITPTPPTSEVPDTPASSEPASQEPAPESKPAESETPSQPASKEPERPAQSNAEKPSYSKPSGGNTDETPSKATSRQEYVDPDNVVSDSGAASVTQRPNTYESHINQNASAVASTSPNANSEDWSNLMSGLSSASSAVSSTTVSMAAGGAGTVTAGKNGGTSSLFMLGVGLIIAAVCGIGAFIYLQFFSHKRRGGGQAGHKEDDYEDSDDFEYATSELERITEDTHPAAAQNSGATRATATVIPRHIPETMEDTIDNFTDINSSSDGIQHREEYEEFVERTKPPIVPKPATRTAPPIYTPPKKDEETLVLPVLSEKEAAKRAQRAQAARAQSHHRQPPITSNAVPRNLRGRPTVAAQTASPVAHPTTQRPVAAPKSTPTPPSAATQQAAARPVAVPKKDTNASSDFDWDKFLNDNRRG
ncbi:hypothetical protein [Caproicibacterium amylolyticum]|uniref:Uncharacterized protein n=1 Tax=Caproicibacterium amylolyticum TaxID=2766537 RepID=A0A7G9WHQ9_9FIRM|nr:hypothetical protein [Caproicibacterium amylolyticum]QNO18221.1 hypothetical protein H6X83_00700 [Caproicibacterium amylolyticum]